MQQANNQGQSGLNENYARELMELHTLGVDGGARSRTCNKWRGRSPAGRSTSRGMARLVFRGHARLGEKTILGVPRRPWRG
jgi:uncharacterized protein (DUF1800 family)